MKILFDTNERTKLNVVLESSSSDVIFDSSGNDRQNFMSVLMPQDQDNQSSMLYIDISHSIDYFEKFLEDFHDSKNKIISLKNGKNE